MNCKERQALKNRFAMLRKRRDFLRKRIGSTPGLSWDRQEVAALRWAIVELGKVYPEHARLDDQWVEVFAGEQS